MMLSRMVVPGDRVRYKPTGEINKVTAVEDKIAYLDKRIGGTDVRPEYSCFITQFRMTDPKTGERGTEFNDYFELVEDDA